MTKIQVRTARLEDLPTLLQFEQGIVSFERPFDPTLADDPISYYDIKSMIGSADAEVVVATVDDKVVASAYGKVVEAKPYFKYKKYAYLGFMFVEPEFRGNGINGKIIDHLNIWAKSKDITEIQLQVYDKNDAAIRAYEKAGFAKYMITMRMEID